MSENQLPVVHKIDDEAFGKLIELPKIARDNEISIAAAKARTAQVMAPWKAIPDIQKISPFGRCGRN